MTDSSKENLSYQVPPKVIADLIDAAPTPSISLSPSGKWMLLLSLPNLPNIEELSKRELRLAGIRIDPQTNGPSRSGHYEDIILKNVQNKKEIHFDGLPQNAKITNLSWSSDEAYFAFTITKKNGLELWLADIKKIEVKKMTEAIINDAMAGKPYSWFSDSKQLIYKSILPDREDVLIDSKIPLGPIIQKNDGMIAPVRTYQDMLRNRRDEAIFEYYTSSQLMILDVTSAQSKPFGEAGIIRVFGISPDGNYVLIYTIKKPFSYTVPYSRFPFDVDIYDRKGNKIKTLFEIPMSENIPKGFGAVREGARNFSWRSDVPACLYWVEAQDGGDPKNEVSIRDQMFNLNAPFNTSPKKVLSFKLRYGGVNWGNENIAIAYEWWWQNRQEVTSVWSPNNIEKGKEVLFDRSWEDSYNSPGNFETSLNKYGRQVLMTDDNDQTLFLFGQGASEKGNRPFVDKFDLKSKKSKRLWRSESPYYEYPISILDKEKTQVFTRKESNDDPPNYYIRNLINNKTDQVTFFENPHLALKNVKKELIKYKRVDGIELTGTLYLPENYEPKEESTLPVLMWAYPREFKSANNAGQVTNSPHEFIRIGWWSPLFWVTQGYAIFDAFGMPIIGEGKEEPNETFISQLVSGAEAAINKLVELGIADRKRIAVGGHSYGAFMTANLLAHSNLFAAGIARSGAYNRTLTPFGFQSEERTLWEAPDTYIKMSPFMNADKIKNPLLLIHGEADNNSGTYPMQSERFYAALKGHGANVRLVMLPHESHSYQARESIMHMLWEMTNWLKIHV